MYLIDTYRELNAIYNLT